MMFQCMKKLVLFVFYSMIHQLFNSMTDCVKERIIGVLISFIIQIIVKFFNLQDG